MSTITAKWAGRCAKCGATFAAGTQVFHAGTRRTYHLDCKPTLATSPIVLKPSESESNDTAAPQRRGGPRKVRKVLAVTAESDGEPWVTFDSGAKVQAAVLSRPELKAAVDFQFPGNGALTKHLTNANLLAALRANSLDGIEAAPAPATAQVDASVIEALVEVAVAKAIADLKPTVIHVNDVATGATVVLEGAQHKLLPEVIDALDCGLNVFLVGPAGSGKSTLASQAFKALDLDTESLSFGPTTPTSKLFGYNDATGNFQGTGFFRSYHLGEAGFLADELDNGHPGLIAELNQATAGNSAAFACGQRSRHDRHRFVATGNTFGRGPDRLFVGRNVLDAATLDRFVTIEVPVDEDLERTVAVGSVPEAFAATAERWVTRVQRTRANAEARNLAIVVSPRASIDGAKLLAKGWSEDKVAERRLFAGIKPDVRGLVDC